LLVMRLGDCIDSIKCTVGESAASSAEKRALPFSHPRVKKPSTLGNVTRRLDWVLTG
jgi:hypothetical protein